MSARNGFETALLNLIFQNTAIANIGNAGGLQPSSADGNFYVALYTVAPTESDPGTECNYTGYARVAVSRDGSTGWTISGDAATNTAVVTFGQCTAGDTDVAVSFAICTGDTEGVDDQILYGALTGSLTIDVGTTPEFPVGGLSVTCN